MALTAEQVLSGADAFVVKVGGDNAGHPDQSREYPGQLREIAGRSVPVGMVVSAVRSSAAEHTRFALVEPEKGFNTTSHLNAMGDALRRGDGRRGLDYLEAVQTFTEDLLRERVSDPGRLEALGVPLAGMFAQMRSRVEEAARVKHFRGAERFMQEGEDRIFAARDGSLVSFTGFGEDLAEALLAENLGGFEKVRSMGLDTLTSAYISEDGTRLDSARAARVSREALAKSLAGLERDLWVMGGAVHGRMASRGYSDVAAVDAMNAWESVPNRVLAVAKQDPILSVDHKLLPGRGRLVSGIHLNASTELFGTHGLDAAALHPDAVKALRHPCVVFNPGDLSRGMTLVSNDCEVREGVLVVGRKPVPALVRVASPDMADRNGVFGRVMDALREATLSHTYTSEGRIVVTVNNKVAEGTLASLEERLKRDLDPSYRVEVNNSGYTMVFALGNALSGAREVGQACRALDSAGIKVHFQDLVTEAGVMKFVVASEDTQKAVGVLHEALVENAATLGS